MLLADLAEHGVTSAQDYWPAFGEFPDLRRIGEAGQAHCARNRMAAVRRIDRGVNQETRLAFAVRSDAAHRNAEGIYGWFPGIAHRGNAEAYYADDPKNSGIPRYDEAKLNDMTRERVLAGFQIGFHAIGDRGVQMALNAFAEAEKAAKDGHVKAANGGDDFRLRIEHAQVTTPAQMLSLRT